MLNTHPEIKECFLPVFISLGKQAHLFHKEKFKKKRAQ